MGTSHPRLWCVAVVFCVVLSSTTAHAKGIPPKNSLLENTCGGILDDANVRIFVKPVKSISSKVGPSFDMCTAMDWFVYFVESAADKKFKTKGKKASRPNDVTDCTEPDLVLAQLSNKIPRSDECDITSAYLSEFKPNFDKRPKWYPPPWKCKADRSGRPLPQGNVMFSESIESGGSSSTASVSIQGAESSDVDAIVSLVASEGSSSSTSRASATSRVQPAQLSQAAVTACMGNCCITMVVKGEMFQQIKTLSERKCSAFDGSIRVRKAPRSNSVSSSANVVSMDASP